MNGSEPNLNYGCVVKFDEAGNVLKSFWDPTGISHASVTSIREHKGCLYLGGLENNRIGRIPLEGADPAWTGYEAYWGSKRRNVRAMSFLTYLRRDLEQILFQGP